MIKVVNVKNREEGNRKAHGILKKLVDTNTLLALSGGTSPDYQKMIVEPVIAKTATHEGSIYL